MALNFPANPVTNQGYTEAGKTWYYTGTTWQLNTVVTSPYIKWAVKDENSAKYIAYNGFDIVTNPTPDFNNVVFNKWYLDNTTNLPLIFTNTIMQQIGNFNTANIFNLSFVNNIINYQSQINSVVVTNNYIYVGGNPLTGTNRGVSQFNKTTFDLIANTPNYASGITTIQTNNGYLYVGGNGASDNNADIKKYYESNLTFVANTPAYQDNLIGLSYLGGTITNYSTILKTTLDNDNIYVVGQTSVIGNFGSAQYEAPSYIKRYNELTLDFIDNSPAINGPLYNIAKDDNYIYTVSGFGSANRVLSKFHKTNLAFVNSVTTPTEIIALTVKDNSIYIGGFGAGIIYKYTNNLSLLGNTPSSNAILIRSLTVDNEFIYAIGVGSAITKYYKNNLAFVTNTPNVGGFLYSITDENDKLYAGIGNLVKQYSKYEVEQIDLYSITNVKGGL